MTTIPDRVFADHRGVTWRLHVARPDPTRDAVLAFATGGTGRYAPPGLYFIAASGELATFLPPLEWLPTAAEIAALTWAELLALLARADHAPAPDQVHRVC